ncbi:unnamed protein product [Miscanthus lutarioriparius]|uniref:Uncharacterized protein n=1 Tax=Miscanthus lutarioriparius TaxID=422564 RepID=A0A811S8W0_9POAL|nr:unnamed protein product [Miscanthus lutarioriparius]
MTTKPSMQSGAAVAEKAAAAGRGVKATEEQARAIICTAKRVVEEAAANKAKTIGRDGAGKPPPPSSLKRSLECFLEGRKNKAPSSSATRRHLETSTASSSSSSN